MRFAYIEICGLRSWGNAPQRITLGNDLAVIYGENSQGKTGLAEALEFLLSGTISRRTLGGGSPGEFHGSLRNAHIGRSATPYVEVGLQGEMNPERALRRTLDRDFSGATDCSSTLTLDGIVIDSARDAGLHLSDPPLVAPILFEHALRYAVSAKPSERADYFKATLEMSDLEVIRTEIERAIAEHRSAARPEILVELEGLKSNEQFSAALALVDTFGHDSIDVALLACLTGITDKIEGATPTNLSEAAHIVSQELETRLGNRLPVGALTVPARALPPVSSAAPKELSTQLLIATARYNIACTSLSDSVRKNLSLFRSALALDRISNLNPGESEDCPLCLTPTAINAARVVAMQKVLADSEALTASISLAEVAIGSLRTQIEAVRSRASTELPDAADWDPGERDAFSLGVAALGGDASAADSTLASILEQAAAAKELDRTSQALLEQLDNVKRSIRDSTIIDEPTTQAIVVGVGELSMRSELFDNTQALAAATALELRKSLDSLLTDATDTAQWRPLLEIVARVDECRAQLSAEQRRISAESRAVRAASLIEAAIRTILDKKLSRMEAEIQKWWELLRPDELTTFNRLSRKGTGKRYLDLTAALSPSPGEDAVIRNALAVLSTSQLNALGLSAFLARSILTDAPIVILDDPVPGSDREHRNTFAGPVMAALLDAGRQVLLTSHDGELVRAIQTIHAHRGIEEFSVALQDPRVGSQVVTTGDDFERLMLDAQSQMTSPLVQNRRSAGNSLRIATERLAKHIIVEGLRRDGNSSVSITDYERKNLSHLRPLVIGYCKEPNEPGEWLTLARILNDSDHDTPPPLPPDLKLCHSTLRAIKKRHGVKTASG